MIEIFNEDNMCLMARYPDKHFDLAIIDPPYGIKEDGRKAKSRLGFVKQKNGNKLLQNRMTYKPGTWDENSESPEYFNELFRVSKNQIIFGANHFIDRIPINSSGWIVWDKCNVGTYQSDCELAWTSFDCTVRKLTFMWSGMIQGSISDGSKMEGNKKLNEKRIHPTQKPVQLYKMILTKYATGGMKILDTHYGSGSIGIACNDLGFDLTACEKDIDYFNASIKRLADHQSQKVINFK